MSVDALIIRGSLAQIERRDAERAFADRQNCVIHLARGSSTPDSLVALRGSAVLRRQLHMFERLHATRKTGTEAFTLGETPLGFTVFDFWRWSSSDLVSNATRGRIAEFLVARALGVDGGIRNEWDAYDLTTASGRLRIEVKSSAYLQSWAQRVVSSVSFDIRETVAWDPDSNTFAAENNRRRQADVYVFALLAHRTKETLNPLDVSQWDFFLLDTSILNQHARKQRRISLERLIALDALRCPYSGLRSLIEGVEARRCPSQL